MASVIYTPSGGGGPVGPFERAVLEVLRQALPATWAIAPNFQLKQRNHDALEYDVVVLAPHGLFVVEAKEWYGRLSGDDQEWLLNRTAKRCPMWTINLKCKVLKSELAALGSGIFIAPAFVVPDGTQLSLGGSWASSVVNLTQLVPWLMDIGNIPSNWRGVDVVRLHPAIIRCLQGKWAARRREARRRIGGYEIVETLHLETSEAHYLARRALIDGDPTRYRIRTWQIDPSKPTAEVDKRKEVVRRPTEAVAKIGRHPNLLPVLQFDYVDEDHEFFEVTEWSDFGTLHGFLANSEQEQLTVRERLEIAEGVAAALEAVHGKGVVHRNLNPSTVLVGFDRKPRLTDFDRAYLADRRTVFADTEGRRDPRFVPPELADAADYDFDATSDMYSFGVLLYQLLADVVPFLSPEAAVAAKGKPARLPSEIRPGLDRRFDALVLGLLRVDDFKARPSATEALAVLRAVLEMTTGVSGKEPTPPTLPPIDQLEVGAILDGVWRLDALLGSGTFASVYRVFNLDHQRTYALKVLTDVENSDLAQHEFNQVAPNLPQHPNIVKIVWMARLGAPLGYPYIVSEFVEGETLVPYCEGDRRLAWRDIRDIGIRLLDALEALHQHGLYHRDIKPANIMLELPSHRPKLIDFNISALATEAKGRAGTRRYWAPDLDQGWGPHADLFSLGVVLFELVMHRHPFPNGRTDGGQPYDPRQIADPSMRLADELAEFLLKAVQPLAANRYESAADMRAELTSVEAMLAPAPPTPPPTPDMPGITLDPSEVGRRNYNPYVTRLLTLYSQARRTNAGTRGLDEIARLTYVETALDQKLAPSIAAGSHRLVIVTGNAGDGKTAFLQRVEALFAGNGVTIERLASGNGSHWTFEGRRFETNYDGSQDEGDRSNDAVLEAFFSPFAGKTITGLDGEQVRLIAINEGRLLDFLAHGPHAGRFDGLKDYVLRSLQGGEQVGGALLINLNHRAVSAGGPQSLVERQLQRILAPELWTPCEACAWKSRCPIKHNVDSLADANSGAPARERVRRLFEVVHLRRRSHVTMRDLRSALSWMLLRDHGCGDIESLLRRTDGRLSRDLASLYYPEAFTTLPAGAAVPQGGERTVDRLVRRLREVDVGLVNDPVLDRRLDHDFTGAVPWMTFERRSPEAWRVLDAITRSTPRAADDVPREVVLSARRGLMSTLRRWAYFERRDSGWERMLPYHASSLLEQVVQPTDEANRSRATEELRNRVVEAISLAEGVRSPLLRSRYLALRITRVRDVPIRSYRLFPKAQFRVEVQGAPTTGDYLEFAPDAVELVSTVGAARLRISLDLLEMLELIRHGYRPTTADLQGLFVNLLIFRNELLSTTFDKVLISADDQDFFEIAGEGRPEGIRLSLVRHGLTDGGGAE